MSDLPAHRPPYNEEAAPFWSGAAEGRLVVPRCEACGHHIWYPRAWCPVCGSESVTWTEMSGRGTVYASTVVHKAMGPWAAAAPYVVAYVELDEGPRILANVVAEDPTEVTIGAGVRATFVAVADPGDDGTADSSERPAQAILRFVPTD